LHGGEVTADVTEATQLREHGGPFPSGGASVNPDTPLALDVIESDGKAGAFDVRFGKPTLQLSFASTWPCAADQ
jgi:hypothetical protein